ncbi:hypothetical protein OIDMADRAFT_18956 [Oidiodendron maius Zn]|uniref:Uncharacterized protein n=1 Tax=Oidiodendron maius (strain Zn) TaxID=913774 RepID=A0A0C3H2L4_OIDMZ|nr:hypothetical protein OIDMADRAFT_18956 [Oidiodendron maius Zn]
MGLPIRGMFCKALFARSATFFSANCTRHQPLCSPGWLGGTSGQKKVHLLNPCSVKSFSTSVFLALKFRLPRWMTRPF